MIFQICLVLDDVDSFEEVLVFCRMSHHWNLSAVSLVVRLGLWVLGRKTTEEK